MLKLEGRAISKSYLDTDGKIKPIIEDIEVGVSAGELVCLLGVSGIGKTTLFNILSGLDVPDRGQVLLDGVDVTGRTGLVGYMQQKDLLLPYRTVLDNICIPLRLAGQKKQEAYQRVLPQLAEFGLEGTEKLYPAQLSGGMRQRAALLRSYLFSGEVMLLDEPFSALDALTKTDMHQWFKQITQRHETSCLFITHDIDEAIMLSDRIYIMSGVPGRIKKELTIDYRGARDMSYAMSPEFIGYKKLILENL